MVQGSPEIEFRVDLGTCKEKRFGELYERHVRLLNLLDRYRIRAMTSDDGLNDIVDMIRSWPEAAATADEAASVLYGYADRRELTLGANHFRVALLRGAAASRAFLVFCLRSAS